MVCLTTLKKNVILSADGLNFCRSEAQRQQLIDNFGWQITGDSRSCIGLSNLSYSVDENSANETVLGVLEVIDPGTLPLTYSIVSGNVNEAFRIDQSTKELIVNNQAELDFETNGLFNLKIELADESFTNYESISVTVNNVNEAPVVQDLMFSLSESIEEGMIIGNVDASDPENDDLTYSIVAGNSDNIFSVSTTGDVILSSNSAINTTPTFNLSLEVSDGELIATAEITIEIDKVTGITDTDFITQIQIYPNPAQESLFLNFGDLQADEFNLEVLDLAGHIFTSQKATEEVNISSLSKGFYLLRIRNDEQIIVTKFFKE